MKDSLFVAVGATPRCMGMVAQRKGRHGTESVPHRKGGIDAKIKIGFTKREPSGANYGVVP